MYSLLQVHIFYDLWTSFAKKSNKPKPKANISNFLEIRMKLSTLLSLVLTFSITLALTSCDDDLNNIGGSLQPPGDNIIAGTDTLGVTARTVSMQDSVYAQTVNGILGKYEDDIFGTIKSDYLCQLLFPEDAKFNDKIASIDAVELVIGFYSYMGDSVSPMGLSAYKVTQPLPEYFYTNADPKKYTDMKTLITSRTFSVTGSKLVDKSTQYRQITSSIDSTFAKDLNAAIRSGKVKDKNTFNEYFPGLYITTTFGTGTLIQPVQTAIKISYSYYTEKTDTIPIRTSTFSLSATTEINQLTHIENKNPEPLFDETSGMTYIKTPAGVYPEIVFPIKKIKENMAANKYASINTALFSVTGYTEKEPTGTFNFGRPSTLLLINKDSVDYFFQNRKLPNNITTFTATRNTASNTYKFNNLSRLITIYKDKNLAKDPTFVLVPVDLRYEYISIYQQELVNVYNKMLPTAAIFRNNIDDMKLSLIYTKF